MNTVDYLLYYPPQPWHSVIHCCCDGLVIIQVTYNVDGKRSMLLLWNPSTRESIVLPNPELTLKGDSLLGLGYDSTSGGYKILKVRTDIDGHKVPSEILSLKSGSWRNIDKHPRGISNVLRGLHSLAFIHDTFHWIGIFGNYPVVPRNYSLVSYSISNEVYKDIPLPRQTLCLRGNITFGVSVLEGMLCVHCSSIQKKETFKLWVLKDYGVKKSWNALLTVEEPWICNIQPKYRFAIGKLLFWCYYSQCRGNAFRTSSAPFVLWPRGDIQHGIAFTESLIAPKLLIY
ncbi:PREDICTED: F-box/kelch-repeat protein At3g23880-like [Nicotiana attenuata]|uniref:F-box/kelch-repeat protein At3g23880-like n=1 Tax=Nicotiana attenuata TaxID=49451 RepID=UPI000904F5B6|nr:PREDICTED: F-box/kelch-repeat protein At3g23880-like [Nicotiana attenuata]